MKILYFLVVLLLFLGISCSSPSGIDEDAVPAFVFSEPPVVTGIWMTDVTGNSLGPWGNPSSSLKGIPVTAKSADTPIITADTIIDIPVEDTYFRLESPTPNPAVEEIIFRFTLPTDTRAAIFVTKARLAGTTEQTSIGGAVVSGSNNIVVTTFKNTSFAAGHHTLTWNSTDDNGKRLPTGFYRIYLVTRGVVLFQDIFLANSREEFLPGMPGKK